MINQLGLQNFMQHTDLTVSFTEGMNGIRGQNEKGKSTLLLAIGYLFYGTRALPLALEDTVTWGVDVNQLKVTMSITIDGAVYEAYRSKNGAELTGNGIRASGQTGVTNFFTSVFGADRDVALKVMISHQDNLRAALEEGSGSLIETLANTNLIDTLITSMQEHYPCGNTKALDLQVASLQNSMGPEPVADFAALETNLAAVTAQFAAAQADARSTSAEFTRLQPAAQTAMSDLNVFKTQTARRQQLTADKQATQQVVDSYVVETLFDTSWHSNATAENARIDRHNKAYAAFSKLELLPVDGTVEQYREGLATLDKVIRELDTVVDKNTALKNQLRTQLVSGGKCPTCGTVLQSQEDIDRHNAHISEKIKLIEDYLATTVAPMAEHAAIRKELVDMDKKSQALLAAALKIGHPSVVIDQTMWPVQVTWVGDTHLAAIDISDIAKQVAHNKRVLKAQADHDMALARLQAITDELGRPVAGVDPVACQEAIDAASAAQARAQAAADAQRAAELAVITATNALTQAQAAHAQALAVWQGQRDSLANLQTAIADMVENNGIIKKLREVRPIVVAEIWGMLLGLVSESFSQIRGVQSVISRDEDGFRIDGKKIKAYSGSTQDSLALAIRATLQKVFLPNIGFTIIDEPGRGMDDTRQSNMLSEVSRLGITQTLVVTHSPLVDVFASNLVEL